MERAYKRQLVAKFRGEKIRSVSDSARFSLHYWGGLSERERRRRVVRNSRHESRARVETLGVVRSVGWPVRGGARCRSRDVIVRISTTS